MVLHDHQLERFGGMPGVNDLGLVESAINSVADHICFLDGNRRVGMAAALVFLRLNGSATNCSEFEDITLKAAAGDLSEEQTIRSIKRLYNPSR